jgi:hypothetical protein
MGERGTHMFQGMPSSALTGFGISLLDMEVGMRKEVSPQKQGGRNLVCPSCTDMIGSELPAGYCQQQEAM